LNHKGEVFFPRRGTITHEEVYTIWEFEEVCGKEEEKPKRYLGFSINYE